MVIIMAGLRTPVTAGRDGAAGCAVGVRYSQVVAGVKITGQEADQQYDGKQLTHHCITIAFGD